MSVKQKQVFAKINVLASKMKESLMSLDIKLLSIFISVFSVSVFSIAIIIVLMGLPIWNQKPFLSFIIANSSIQYNLLITFKSIIMPTIIVSIPSIVISIMLFGELSELYKCISIESYNEEENISRVRKRGLLFPLISILVIYVFGDMLFKFLNIYNPMEYYSKLGWIVMPLLVIANNAFIFREIVFGSKKLIAEREERREEEKKRLKADTDECLKKIDSRYIEKMNLIVDGYKKNYIYYNNEEFGDIIESVNSSKYVKSLELVLDGKNLTCKASNENIVKCTNEEKKELIYSSMKQIESKYSADLDSDKRLNDAIENIRSKYNYLTCETFIKKEISKNNIKWNSLKFFDMASVEYNNIASSRIDVLRDIDKYLTSRISYLFSSYKIANAGVAGEEKVNKELNKYSDEFINISNKAINLKKFNYIKDEHVMEVDNIVISSRGVFVLEIKNKGESKSGKLNNNSKILIEPEGRWVTVDKNNNKELWSWTPVEQNRTHVKNIRDIINSNLGLKKGDDNYIEPIGVIVIANDTVDIENRSDECVSRVSKLYDIFNKGGNIELSEEQMLKIKDIFDCINDEPTRYPVIDVYSEMLRIECILQEIRLESESIMKDFSDLRNLIEDYSKEVSSRISKYNDDIGKI